MIETRFFSPSEFETLKEYYNTYMFQNVNGAKFVDLWNKKGIDIDKIISEYK